MKSSILIVGHPRPEQVEFGADHSTAYDDALHILKENKYAVVVAGDKLPIQDTQKIKDSFTFLKSLRELHDDTQTVLVSQVASAQDLQKVINIAGVFKTIPQFDSNLLQLAVREALEEYELIKQNQAFVVLTQEQNQKLQHLTGILEERVKAREEFLVEARERLLHATRRQEALNRALVAIQKSISRTEMERHLTDALNVALGLSWIRILFHDQDFLDQMAGPKMKNTTIFSSPLFRDTQLLGHIYFAREFDKPFSPDEDDFLLQVGDAVGLAIDRLRALDAIEALKQEWDSTFDAITDPVAIVSENREVIRANKAYALRAQVPVEHIAGHKCYEILFNRKSPCENCQLGSAFDMGEVVSRNKNSAHFNVSSHLVPLNTTHRSYAMFYHDVSEQEKIQRQILESSKMAEIGTIGSSIAHEINNPLGGMIAFLQILKMEIKPEDKIYSDVVEMEQAAIRCKTIVENLLAFTRQSLSADLQVSTIAELLKVVTNIMELQTRGLGIKLEKHIENSDVQLQTDTNQLIQVLVNVIQNSCESIAERMSEGRRQPPGLIQIKTRSIKASLSQETGLSSSSEIVQEKIRIEIVDNGKGVPSQDLPRIFTPFFTTKDRTKNPGLGLSVSYQIVKEHGGQMEVSSVSGQSTTVVITLPIAKSPTP